MLCRFDQFATNFLSLFPLARSRMGISKYRHNFRVSLGKSDGFFQRGDSFPMHSLLNAGLAQVCVRHEIVWIELQRLAGLRMASSYRRAKYKICATLALTSGDSGSSSSDLLIQRTASSGLLALSRRW